MKIYDCFQFYNELDILEIRLNELDSQVDYFVLVEAELSHQSKPKILYFQENKNRFEKYLDKIIHVVVSKDEFKTNDAWYNENLQRKKLLEGIGKANPDDLILIADCDEIISATSLKFAKDIFSETPNEELAYVFEQNLYFWYLNTRANNYAWVNAGIAKKKTIDKIGTQSFKSNVTFKSYPRIKNAGWHFSYIGTSETVKTKIDNFAHTEFSHIKESELNVYREKLIDPLGRMNEGIDLVIDPINTMPEYVEKNIDRFAKYIKV